MSKVTCINCTHCKVDGRGLTHYLVCLIKGRTVDPEETCCMAEREEE